MVVVMTTDQRPYRRAAARFSKALRVRFTVNGGPELHGRTINFTSRSVAIGCSCKVEKHDEIVAHVDDLPEIKGSVVRVFDGGFAILFDESSLALIAHAGAGFSDAADEAAPQEEDTRVLSPVFRIDAPSPAWGQITTHPSDYTEEERHLLSIVTTGNADVENIHGLLLSINDNRWTAPVLQAKIEHGQKMIVVPLSEKQFRMAAKDGLTISIVKSEKKEWQARLDQAPFDAHLKELEPEPGAALSA